MNFDTSARLLRLRPSADYIGVSVSTFYKLIRAGVVPALTLPGLAGPRFDRKDLDALIDRARLAK
jgi:excisionase family DNA binding protein